MPKTYIFEANTTNAAIEKGLKELKVSRNQVDIKVLEEAKKSFFSILAPRIVKVEFTLKDNTEPERKEHHKFQDVDKIEHNKKYEESELTRVFKQEDIDKQMELLRHFMDQFIATLPTTDLKYELKFENNAVFVILNDDRIQYLVGYRAEIMYALQNVLNGVCNNHVRNGARVILNVNGYREKREESLNNLAEKLARTVEKTKKSITLEPMNPYERMLIHTKLRENTKVETHSIGKEPYRKIVISLKK